MAKTSLDAFKAKDYRFVADWLKSKGLHKLCYVLEGIQEPFILLWHVRVLSIKPCLHTQLPEHNRSYLKVSRGWGIWSPGMDLWWGIWTAFRPLEGGIFQKFSKNSNARGLPGGDVEASIWLVHKFSNIVFPVTGSPSSKYVVYATACVYRELYEKITDRKKNCVNNYLIWNKVFLPQLCRALISCADFKSNLTPFSENIWNRCSSF